jgi:cytoskeletal protein CcmA (bactofilin family)
MSYFNASIKIPGGNDIDLTDTTGNIISIKSGTLAAEFVNFTLPTSNGTNGQVLQTDGSGNLTYSTVTSDSLAADNITEGDNNINITTTTGNVFISPENTKSLFLSDGLSNIITVASNVVSVNGNVSMDTNKSLVFRDSALSINSSADGQLDIDADTTLQITAPTVDINASTEVNVSGALTVGGATNIDDTTQSTSTSTGALIVDGGVGVAKDVSVGGNVNVSTNLVVTGDLTVNGTTTTINSNVTTIDDPVIELGTAGVSETFDRGIRYHFYDGSAKNGFFGLDRSESVFTFYSDATFTTSNVVASGTLGNARFSGLTANATTNSTGIDSGALVVNGGVGIANDVYMGNELHLLSDAAVLNFGADNDVTLTHVADTGLLLNGASELQFRDSALTIGSTTDGQLDIAADTKLQLTAPTVNTSADLGVVGTFSLGAGLNEFTISESSDDITLKNTVQDKDIIVNSNVGGTDTEIFRVDGSNASVLLATSNKVEFRNSTNAIYSGTPTDLNIDAGGLLQMTATTANVDGNFETSGNITVAGTVTVNDTTSASGAVDGALLVQGGVNVRNNLVVANDVTTSANVAVGKALTVGIDSITATDAATEIITSIFQSSVKSFKLNNGTALTYHSNAGVNGQMLHLFYDNLNASGSANIDFGVNGLYVGSGTAQYLKFTQTGQSATMIYIDGTDANAAGWRIINTGGTVS